MVLFPIFEAISGEFDKPANTVGYANCFGELQFTGHLGTVAISRGEVYDFYYQYSSSERADSPHLGRGFFVPLMECRITDYDHFIEYTTLGGARGYLYRLPADPDRYLSQNGRISGQRLGDNTFVRRTDDGFVLTYRDGRLAEFETSSGAVVSFRYEGDLCSSVVTSSGQTIITWKVTGENSRELRTGAGAFSIELGNYPARFDAEMDALGKLPDEEPTMTSLAWPDGKRTRFDYQVTDDNRVILSMIYGDQRLDFEWVQHSGYVLRAGDVEYAVSGLARDFDPTAERIAGGSWSVRRRYADGSWDFYSCDEDAAIVEEESDRSPLTRTWMIPNRGPAFWKVRKRERQGDAFEGSDWETFYEAFYDQEGRLIREIDGGRLRWHLHPGGLPLSLVKPEDDFFSYDEKGRLVRRRVEQVETVIDWRFDGSRRIVSTYPWGEVNLRYYDAGGNPAPIPGNETFPEQQQARIVADNAP